MSTVAYIPLPVAPSSDPEIAAQQLEQALGEIATFTGENLYPDYKATNYKPYLEQLIGMAWETVLKGNEETLERIEGRMRDARRIAEDFIGSDPLNAFKAKVAAEVTSAVTFLQVGKRAKARYDLDNTPFEPLELNVVRNLEAATVYMGSKTVRKQLQAAGFECSVPRVGQALNDLCADGYVISYQATSKGGLRQVYALAPSGKEKLHRLHPQP